MEASFCQGEKEGMVRRGRGRVKRREERSPIAKRFRQLLPKLRTRVRVPLGERGGKNEGWGQEGEERRPALRGRMTEWLR